MGWLRCSLSFSLLRSAIQCTCGACSSIGHYVSAPPPMDLVRVESNLTIDSNVPGGKFVANYNCCKIVFFVCILYCLR